MIPGSAILQKDIIFKMFKIEMQHVHLQVCDEILPIPQLGLACWYALSSCPFLPSSSSYSDTVINTTFVKTEGEQAKMLYRGG